MPVSYEGAQTLKSTVNFNFSRYITGATAPTPITYPVTEESDSSEWTGDWSVVNQFENADLFELDPDDPDAQ